MSKKFAKTICVVLRDDNDTDGPYMIADTDVDGFDHGESVATYQLVSVSRLRVSRDLVHPNAKLNAKAKWPC